VDDPVTDARNDLEERAFPGGAGSHSSGQISYGILRVELGVPRAGEEVGYTGMQLEPAAAPQPARA
jgi:hypothetical protein